MTHWSGVTEGRWVALHVEEERTVIVAVSSHEEQQFGKFQRRVHREHPGQEIEITHWADTWLRCPEAAATWRAS